MPYGRYLLCFGLRRAIAQTKPRALLVVDDEDAQRGTTQINVICLLPRQLDAPGWIREEKLDPHVDPDTGRTGSGCGSPLDSADGAIELSALAPPQGTSQYSDHGEPANNQEEHEAGGQEEPGFQFRRHDGILPGDPSPADLGKPIESSIDHSLSVRHRVRRFASQGLVVTNVVPYLVPVAWTDVYGSFDSGRLDDSRPIRTVTQ